MIDVKRAAFLKAESLISETEAGNSTLITDFCESKLVASQLNALSPID